MELVDFQITTGNRLKPSAMMELKVDGENKIGQGMGVGPVDASWSAIRNIVDPDIKLKNYNLKAVTGGTDALAQVSIQLEDSEGHLFSADAISEDVIMASVLALIKGLNRVLHFKQTLIKRNGNKGAGL